MVFGISDDDLFARLEPYHERLSAILWTAWKRSLALRNHETLIHVRTNRNVMYDFIAQEVRALFENVENVELIEEHEQILVVFTDAEPPILLRFKHLDDEYFPRNYPTARAERLAGWLTMPGLPRVRLYIGYLLDEAETAIEHAVVMKMVDDGKKGLKPHVVYELNAPGSTNIATLPIQPDLSPPARTGTRVTRKKGTEVAKKKLATGGPKKSS